MHCKIYSNLLVDHTVIHILCRALVQVMVIVLLYNVRIVSTVAALLIIKHIW